MKNQHAKEVRQHLINLLDGDRKIGSYEARHIHQAIAILDAVSKGEKPPQ